MFRRNLGCLWHLSVLPDVMDWFLLATDWAAVIRRVRYLGLISPFLSEADLQKILELPLRRPWRRLLQLLTVGILLGMVGSRGTGGCIDGAAGFRGCSTPWSRSWFASLSYLLVQCMVLCFRRVTSFVSYCVGAFVVYLIEFDLIYFLTTWQSRSTSFRSPSLSFSHQRCQLPRRHATGKVMRNGSRNMRQFPPNARNRVCLLFFRCQSIIGISFLLLAPAAFFWKFRRSKSMSSSGRVLMGISCLGNLSVHQKVKNCIRHATCWASDYLLERHQVLLAVFSQGRLFRKFSGYPFGDNGGVFCSFCRLVSILAMTGSEDQRLHRLQGGY